MNRMIRKTRAGSVGRLILALVALTIASCTYRDRVAPIRLPDSSPNMVVVNGLKILAAVYLDNDAAAEVYGFDIRKAGILPVQLTMQNDGDQPVRINPEQTFLLDDDNNAWPILSLEKTHQRTSSYVKIGESVKGAATPSILMGAAGAVAGLAIGIVSGENIGETMGKGAIIGAAGGAIVGGSEAAARSGRTIRKDLAEKSMRNTSIQPGQIAYGTLFFPGAIGGEAQSASQLRLTLTFDLVKEQAVTLFFDNP